LKLCNDLYYNDASIFSIPLFSGRIQLSSDVKIHSGRC
jgi:hypothetical protein